MTDPFSVFDERIIALHQGKPEAPRMLGEKIDLRAMEFRTLVESFLPGHDPKEIAEVENEQIRLHGVLNKLAGALQAGVMPPRVYVDLVNTAQEESIERCQKILGDAAFEQLFGTAQEARAGLIDPEVFMEKFLPYQRFEKLMQKWVVAPQNSKKRTGKLLQTFIEETEAHVSVA